MNKDFIEIVKAAQNGDNRAFETLYNMTKDSSYFIALSITKNEQDALDIMQDSYIKAFKGILTLKTPESFDNWMGRIVANTSKNYITRKKPMLFEDIGPDASLEWNEEEFNKEYLPEESMDMKETSRLLLEIINGLSSDKRLCILMYYYQDMSVNEIAEALEIPVSTVKYKLLSARAEIKKGVEALEKKGTKLYGVFPFILLPVVFKSIEADFLKLHIAPQYTAFNMVSKAVQGKVPSSQLAKATKITGKSAKSVGKSAVKKGFFSTLAGKITAVASVLFVGVVIATVISPKTDTANGTSSADLEETQRAIGYEYTSSDGLYEYKVMNDGNAKIIGYNEPNTTTELVVPSNIDGYTVTIIGYSAFCGLENTISITLPDTITKLSDCAFSDGSVTVLEGGYLIDKDGNHIENATPGEYTPDVELYIPTGNELYKNVNPSLKEVILPDSLTEIPDRCFRGCSSIETIKLPEHLEHIHNDAFQHCSALKSIEFPNSVYSIDFYAFYGCFSLTEVTFPSSLEYLGTNSFEYCTSLEKVYFEEGFVLKKNPDYAYLPVLKGFVVGNPSLKEIHIPASYTELFDFVTYDMRESVNNEFVDLETPIPNYEKTFQRGELEAVRHITFYGETGSLTEEVITNCGLTFVAE